VKAAPVPALSDGMPLPEAARRLIATRSAELFAFVPAALDERNARTLHDMRIAAKRLRYVLELLGFAIGEPAEEAEAAARELQTVIGEIHDHDVLISRLEALSSSKSSQRGVRELGLRLHGRRDVLFSDFVALWASVEESGLRERLLAATTFSPNGSARPHN
jgi:CHAD domain-containing protein